MRQVTLTNEMNTRRNRSFARTASSLDLSRLTKLTEDDRAEVMAFLKIRPIHTVVMASFINDNGMVSDLNRGAFFGYREETGELEGVALIGHTTLIEAHSDEAMAAFAAKANADRTAISLIMSDHTAALDFWSWYAPLSKPRQNFTELLFETAFPMLVHECGYDVRPADLTEIDQVAEAHAEVAFIETGRDPMVTDREGFLKRVARRIEMDRTFVVFEGDTLIFKADIVAEADGIIYLEGVYVAPDLRGKGVGSRCLSRLNMMLLERADRICMLSNERFAGAHRSFEKAGYHVTGRCTTLFV